MFSGFNTLISDPRSFLYRIPAILIGLTFHEWAHAFAADKLGDPTAKNMGRMTLNPIAHIDPIGLASLLLLGFGWAKPVPVNARNFKNFRRDDIIVSLAGITANLLIALITTLVLYPLVYLTRLGGNDAFTQIMLNIIGIDLSLAVFNLIPLYPLDGSHVAESLLFRYIPKVFFFLRKYGYYILLALMLTGVLTPVLSAVANWLFGLFQSLAIRITLALI